MIAQELAQKYIQELGLAPHPEGGWFTLVHLSEDKILSPYVQQGDRERSLNSAIYYLLAPEGLQLEGKDKPAKFPASHRSHAGYFHTNNSTTVHTWHSGKAVYTLIKVPDDRAQAGATDSQAEAEVKRLIMGDNLKDGETMILVVPPGWWKRSQTLSPDGHCLISETVTPAWVPEDHKFMAPEDLKEAVGDSEDLVEEFSEHILPEGHQLEF